MSSDARINNEPGFILHTYPFKETSVVAEVFTRSHGRVALIARGARRPASALRGLMQPFTPLLLSWFGKSELKTLHGAEWQGGLIAPQGRALMCGFYLNELLLRLLARGDAHELLYDRYVGTLDQLAGECTPLRRFLSASCAASRRTCSSEIGYGATFDFDADSGAPIEPDAPLCVPARARRVARQRAAGVPGLGPDADRPGRRPIRTAGDAGRSQSPDAHPDQPYPRRKAALYSPAIARTHRTDPTRLNP